MIVMLGMIAFAVDVGYMGWVRTQLQVAADSSALAAAGSSNLSQDRMVQVAQGYAQYHQVAGRKVVLNPSDVEFGTWDVNSQTFTPLTGTQLGTAVKVTVYADTEHGGNAGLFFGGIFGVNSVTSKASAVAMVNPRDICFVVDLSSSMRNDSTPPGNWRWPKRRLDPGIFRRSLRHRQRDVFSHESGDGKVDTLWGNHGGDEYHKTVLPAHASHDTRRDAIL